MDRHIDVPVLIVGAGPTGLTLACDLARRGVRCRVIDKAAALFVGSRGKGLQPRTLEVFDDLGVIDAVLAAGAPFPGFRCYAGHRLLWDRSFAEMLGVPPPTPTPDVPYPSAWLIPQWRTDEILRDRLVALGGRVELSTELIGFDQDGEGVTATLTRDGATAQVRAGYLVGADGGRSVVRKALGVGFAGETFEVERTLIGDVRVDGPLDHTHCHLLTRSGDMSSPHRFSLWGLPGTDYFQFVVNMTAADAPALTLGALQAMMEERSGRTDIRLHDLNWISLYRVNARMAERFRVGRVFLAGDAAHTHSSAGGQGLNTSVQDAYNLGWKLGAVLAGAPQDLLDTYEAERMPIAADLLGLTTAWHRQDFGGPATEERPAGEQRGSSPAIYQLTLTYRGGPLARDERDTPLGVQAGDRAPDAPCRDATGAPMRLFDLFRGPHVTLLAFGQGAGSTVAAINARYAPSVHAYAVVRPHEHTDDDSIIDTDGHAHHGYAVDPTSKAGTLILVRPDGYLGLISDQRSAGRVDDYLRRIVSGPGLKL